VGSTELFGVQRPYRAGGRAGRACGRGDGAHGAWLVPAAPARAVLRRSRRRRGELLRQGKRGRGGQRRDAGRGGRTDGRTLWAKAAEALAAAEMEAAMAWRRAGEQLAVVGVCFGGSLFWALPFECRRVAAAARVSGELAL
jgi:hypothetical protein